MKTAFVFLHTVLTTVSVLAQGEVNCNNDDRSNCENSGRRGRTADVRIRPRARTLTPPPSLISSRTPSQSGVFRARCRGCTPWY